MNFINTTITSFVHLHDPPPPWGRTDVTVTKQPVVGEAPNFPAPTTVFEVPAGLLPKLSHPARGLCIMPLPPGH